MGYNIITKSVKYIKPIVHTYRYLLRDEACSMLVVPKGLKQGELGCLFAILLFNNNNMLNHMHRKMMQCKKKFNYIYSILYYYIPTNKIIFQCYSCVLPL
jgi:hypothetical protein